MARDKASVDAARPRDEVFAYLSDFSTTEEWDPGVVEAERIGDAAVGEGTEFRLVAVFLGRKNELTYRIVEYDPPDAVTFRGENSTVVSLDRITFEPSDGGTRITYDAELTLKVDLEESRADLAFYEVPVLSTVYNPARWFIDGCMARGVATDSARARTITVYSDVATIVRELGLSATDTIAVLLVERSGRVLGSELGGFDEHKAQRLAAALEHERAHARGS